MECPKIKRCRNKTAECKDMRFFGDTYLCFEHKYTNLVEYRINANKKAYHEKKRKEQGK